MGMSVKAFCWVKEQGRFFFQGSGGGKGVLPFLLISALK